MRPVTTRALAGGEAAFQAAGVLRKLLRSCRTVIPWLALAEPLCLYTCLFALKSLFPDLFCVAVEPGGKEFICGADYSHPNIRLLQALGLSVWVVLIVIGGVEVFQRRASRPAVIAWSLSALLFVGIAFLWLTLPVVDAP